MGKYLFILFLFASVVGCGDAESVRRARQKEEDRLESEWGMQMAVEEAVAEFTDEMDRSGTAYDDEDVLSVMDEALAEEDRRQHEAK